MKPPEFPTGSNEAAGSSREGEPAFLAVGRLRKPHGLRGDIRMEVLTDFPERLEKGMQLYVGEEYQPMKLRSLKLQDTFVLVSFEGYDTPEQAAELRSKLVYVTSADRPSLEEGEYYHHQLIGLETVTEDGRVLGTVAEILETGANDVLVVRPVSGPEILLPMLDEVVLDVDLEAGRMVVKPLPGLIGDS